MKGRLSPCEADPIDPTLKRAKASKSLFKWNRKILLRMKDKKVVMAVWTPKVAIRKEENRANFSWPIHKGGL
jgi:hypothetical protein